MKGSLLLLIALVSVLAMAASVYGQGFTGPQVTVTNQIGTPEVQRDTIVNSTTPLLTKRVGVLAYCADIAPRAAAVGIFSQDDAQANSGIEVFPALNGWGNLRSSPTGHFGAQNIVDMLMYDDEIPRFRDVVLIDGDRDLPTGAQLAQNFDCVIAYTDNKCGVPIPVSIANAGAKALADFVALSTPAAPKGVVLTGFAFNQSIGFGNGIFAAGLSPLKKASAAADPRCSPPGDVQNPTGKACPIGRCEPPAERQFPAGVINPSTGRPVSAPECVDCPATAPDGVTPCINVTDTATGLTICQVQDGSGSFCGNFVNPVFDNFTPTDDRVCDSLFQGVSGPTSASLANALALPVALDRTATLCATYDRTWNDLPLIAVNQARNVVALNVFPATAEDLRKTWFSCILANAAILACGEKRCIPDPNNPTTGTICK